MCFLTTLVALGLPALAAAAPALQNMTIAVPEGTSNHGDSRLLCVPTRATDVASFFLVNFVAHAATVASVPGEPGIPLLLAMVYAFAFPVYGVIRGMRGIFQATVFEKDPVRAALKAGALCEVVRTRHWRPRDGDVVQMRARARAPARGAGRVAPASSEVASLELRPLSPTPIRPSRRRREDEEAGEEENHGQDEGNDGESAGLRVKVGYPDNDDDVFPPDRASFSPATGWHSFQGRSVHGRCELPEGYALHIVPADADVRTHADAAAPPARTFLDKVVDDAFDVPGRGAAVPTLQLSCAFNIWKGLAAMLQLGYGSYTLYRSRGDQVDRFGYAAFGLTVAPYVVMSFVNLLSSALTPQYSCVYLVRTAVMAEAERPGRGGRFVGEIGTLQEPAAATWSWDAEAEGNFTAEFAVSDGPDTRFRPVNGKDLSHILGEPGPEGYYSFPAPRRPRWSSRQIPPVRRRANTTYSHQGDDSNSSASREATTTPTREESGLSPATVINQGRPIHVSSLHASAPRRRSRTPPRRPGVTIVAASSSTFRGGRAWLYDEEDESGWSMLIGLLPLAIVGGISGFRAGGSTLPQRAWTMSWLVVGITLGPVEQFYSDAVPGGLPNLILRLGMLIYGAPAVGGLVMVAQMMMEYGTCIQIIPE